MEPFRFSAYSLRKVDERLEECVSALARRYLAEHPTWHYHNAADRAVRELSPVWATAYVDILAADLNRLVRHGGAGTDALVLVGDAISEPLVRLRVRLTTHAMNGWFMYYRETNPGWSDEYAAQEALRRVMPAIEKIGDKLWLALLIKCQALTGLAWYDRLLHILVNDATEYRDRKHHLDLPAAGQPPVELMRRYTRYVTLWGALARRGEGGLPAELRVAHLVEPVWIDFQPGSLEHSQARENVGQFALDNGLTSNKREAFRRLKIIAGYQVLAEFDRPYKKKFGNQRGDTMHAFEPTDLRWRDLLTLFDDEVRKACLAILLDQHYPNKASGDVAYRDPLALLDGHGTAHDALLLSELRDEVQSLLGSTQLTKRRRTLLSEIYAWLGENNKTLNLVEFCHDSGRDYEATRKQFHRIVRLFGA